MLMRTIALFGLATLSVVFAGCSGSDGSNLGTAGTCTTGASSFCLVSCNLGCSALGCQVTQIAQNQPIELNFSEPVDPGSVNGATVSIKTASGEPPVGKLQVSGSTIVFQPEIQIKGGQTFFGFRANETYILSLAGGPNEPQAIRSLSRDPLGTPITCTLNVSLGIVDLDGRVPIGTLVSPSTKTGVSPNVTIVVEFSEILDVAPFQGTTASTAPVQYRLRKTIASGACDPNFSPLPLGGVPQAVVQPPSVANPSGLTQVVLRPAVKLPSDSCVEIEVTPAVRDLSGKSADPLNDGFDNDGDGEIDEPGENIFTFTIAEGVPTEQQIVENFADERQLDRDFSGGTWSGGEGRPGPIGGDGRLGDFDVTLGNEDPQNQGVFEWNTDNFTIPGSKTLSGQPETVTDGVFRFSRFHLPAGQTIRFVGSKIPRVLVRGSADIEGTVDVSATQVPSFTSTSQTGQPGGPGGIGGGRGGRGADRGDGSGNKPEFNGQDGETVQLPGGHAYSSRAPGTGGNGAPQYPASGLNSAVTFNHFTLSGQIQGGGGGGGFATMGGAGTVVMAPSGEAGPDTPGGSSISLLPFPPPGGATSLEHFLVGGSGGGGGGSHPFFSPAAQITWRPGGGGAGGGGVLNLRAGGDVIMTSGSAIQVRGGDGGDNNIQGQGPPPGPGGGGSGGSVLLQVGNAVQMGGIVDAGGGKGGFTQDQQLLMVHVRGGDGAPGYVRLEMPGNPSPGAFGNTVPAATSDNVGPLTATDQRVGFQSRFYATRQVFAPEYLRYELQAELGGQPVVFTDDPSWTSPFGPNVGRAVPGQAIEFFVQGAKVDPTSGTVDPGSIGPWRTWVARQPGPDDDLNDDDATGYRFLMLFDRGVTANAVVKKFTVFFRG